MLWSESRRATSYYHAGGGGRWSGYWLLDRTGERIASGLIGDDLNIEDLLAELE